MARKTAAYWYAAAFIVSIGILEYSIYFYDLHHFFQGDTTFWLYYRARSVADFLGSFAKLDPGGWYRPIGNLLLPSILFPAFGLAPQGYRIVLFLLFFANTAVIFVLLWRLTRRSVVAGAGTFFFATHTVHTITTYDLAFAAELFYSLFYLGAVITYLRFVETRSKRMLLSSVVLCIGGLFSKESASTLPAMLIFLSFVTADERSVAKRAGIALWNARWHVLVLAVYLVFVVGHLHVGGVTLAKLLHPAPAIPGEGGYEVVFGRSVLNNLDYALTWAFNLPRLPVTTSREVPGWGLSVLKTFRLIIAALAVAVLFDEQMRKWLLIGLGWFVIGVFPALLLRDHLLPYYLCLPVAGFSLLVGTALDWLYNRLTSFNRLAATVVCFLPLVLSVFPCAISTWNEVSGSSLLGFSSTLAANTLRDLRMVLPEIPPNRIIYILDQREPDLAYAHASGGLIKLDRGEERLDIRYASSGAVVTANERDSVIVLEAGGGHLRDVTRSWNGGGQR